MIKKKGTSIVQNVLHNNSYLVILLSSLALSSLAITLRTTRFKIQKYYTVLTLRLSVLYGSHNKQKLLPYTTLADWFCITEVVSVHCAVRSEPLSLITHLARKIPVPVSTSTPYSRIIMRNTINKFMYRYVNLLHYKRQSLVMNRLKSYH